MDTQEKSLPKIQSSDELRDEQLDTVAGGLNPQPEPPAYLKMRLSALGLNRIVNVVSATPIHLP